MHIAPRQWYRWLGIATLAAVATLGMGGCGPSVGSENAEVIGALAEAQDLLRQAHQGFQTGGAPQPVHEYRDALYRRAVQLLQNVKDQGTPSQQVAVQRLLAQVHQAQADGLTRQAVGRWAQLAIRQAELSSLLLKAQQASLQQAALGGDEGELQEALLATQQQLSRQADDLRQQQAKIDQAIQANRDRAQAVVAQADSHSGTAERLRDQAFVAEGQQRYDLELACLEAQRQANAALTERDSLDCELSLSLNPQRQIVQRQLQTIEQIQQQVKQELDDLRQRGQRAAELRRSAQQRAESALAELRQAWEQVVRALQADVQAKLDAAQESAANAVRWAESASRRAEHRVEAQTDVLGAQMQLAHTQVTAAGVLSASAEALGQLAQAVQSAAASSASYFVDSAAQISQRAAAARQAAKSAIGAARATALQIAAASDEETGKQAQGYLDRVQALENQLAGRWTSSKAAPTGAATAAEPSAKQPTDGEAQLEAAKPGAQPPDQPAEPADVADDGGDDPAIEK